MFNFRWCMAAFAISIALRATEANACGDLLLQAEDGTFVNARSLEFGIPLESTVKAYSRGKSFQSDAPNRGKGLKWASKYGYVGIDALGIDAIFDGLNEKGLSIGALWMPTSDYQEIAAENISQALDVAMFSSWVLGNFSTVDEVKAALPKVHVFGQLISKLGMVPPLHFAIHDASGKSLVVEFIKGQQAIHDNPIGVLTNYPTFQWHIDNLRNYAKLGLAANVASIDFDGVLLETYGQGTGLLGITGDWTPASRFVKLAYLKKIAKRGKNGAETVNLAEHLFNIVDIPYGVIQSDKEKTTDYTQWIVIKDLSNRILYYRTYGNLALRSVDLKALDFSSGSKLKEIRMDVAAKPQDVSQEINPRK